VSEARQVEAPFGLEHRRDTNAAIAVPDDDRHRERAAEGIVTVTAITRTNS